MKTTLAGSTFQVTLTLWFFRKHKSWDLFMKRTCLYFWQKTGDPVCIQLLTCHHQVSLGQRSASELPGQKRESLHGSPTSTHLNHISVNEGKVFEPAEHTKDQIKTGCLTARKLDLNHMWELGSLVTIIKEVIWNTLLHVSLPDPHCSPGCHPVAITSTHITLNRNHTVK